ncbi:MAG TPA: PEP-CTERM sorting domain-containing protein [Opitutaceae bacterium]
MPLPFNFFGCSSRRPARTALATLAAGMLLALMPARTEAQTVSSLRITGGDAVTGNWLTFDNGTQDAVLTFVSGSDTEATIAAKVRLRSDLRISHNLAGHTLTFGTVVQGGNDQVKHDITVEGAGNVAFDQNIANVDAFTFASSGNLTFAGTTTLGSLTLTGGLLELSTSHLTIDTLTITGDTIIDFGTHGESFIYAGQITIAEGATLTIRNWTEATDYFYASLAPTSANLAAVTFEGHEAGSAWSAYDGQISPFQPVPEPSATGALVLGAALGAFWLHRRRRRD